MTLVSTITWSNAIKSGTKRPTLVKHLELALLRKCDFAEVELHNRRILITPLVHAMTHTVQHFEGTADSRVRFLFEQVSAGSAT
jgi:hypothetical protein